MDICGKTVKMLLHLKIPGGQREAVHGAWGSPPLYVQGPGQVKHQTSKNDPDP